jgi:hypothetical protein
MKNYIVSENQFNKILHLIEDSFGLKNETDVDNIKQKLFTITTLSQKIWEMIDEEEEIDESLLTKLSECESIILDVAKAYLYNGMDGTEKKLKNIDFNDLIIGKK